MQTTALITCDLIPSLWDAKTGRPQTDLAALASLQMLAPLGLIAAGDWPTVQRVQRDAGIIFDECHLVHDDKELAGLWQNVGSRLRSYSKQGQWWHFTADPAGEALARAAGAKVAFVPRSQADSGQLVLQSQAEVLVSDLHQLVLGLQQGALPVRDDLVAVAAHPKFLKEYIKWLAEEQGPELLRCEGCLEFRVLRIGDNSARLELLFRNMAALQSYLAEQAPILHAKTLERFPPDWLSFSRSHSTLLATRARRT